MQLWEGSRVIPVSYTHLDVYKRQVLNERERLIRFFQTHEAERERFLELCAEIGKTGRYSVFDYIYNLAEMKMEKPWKHYLNILLIIIAIGLIFIQPQVGILSLIFMISVSMGQYLSLIHI